MSEGLSVQRIGLDSASRPVEPAVAENQRPAQSGEARAAEAKAAESKAVEAKTALAQDAAQAAKARQELPVREMGDVRLKYHIDDKTKEVTVELIDRVSRRVIRTIPPDELKNFREGDLFELSS